MSEFVRHGVGCIRFAWTSRWGLLRLALVVFVLWIFVVDTGARTARRALSLLPEFDFAGEAAALRTQGRYAESLMILERGLARTEGSAREALLREQEETRREQSSWLRRARDAGWGALTGRAESLEGLVGATGADMLIVGDVRDLLIEGTKWVKGDDPDEILAGLSTVGLFTTLVPEIDWAPSFLKVAKRAGHLSEPLTGVMRRAVSAGRWDELRSIFRGSAELATRTTPGTAMRMLRHADNAEELAAISRFAEKHPDASLVLHAGDDAIMNVIKNGDDAAHRAAIAAGVKGRGGLGVLSSRAGRVLLRPHPLVGLTKGLWKGNVGKLIAHAAARLDAHAWWVMPVLAFWAITEGVFLVRRARTLWRRETPKTHQERVLGATAAQSM